MNSANVCQNLEVIRQATRLFAAKFSMTSNVLRPTAEIFRTVIDNGELGNDRQELTNMISELASELQSDAAGVRGHVEALSSFEAVGLFDRIVAIRNEIESVDSP